MSFDGYLQGNPLPCLHAFFSATKMGEEMSVRHSIKRLYILGFDEALFWELVFGNLAVGKESRSACEAVFLDERLLQMLVAHHLTEFHYLHK